MKTILKFGPADHDRPVSEEDLVGAQWEEGYKYEIIDGRIYVSPTADLDQDQLNDWILERLKDYSKERPDAINWVTAKGRVIVPGVPRMTAPEPDVTAFRDFPKHLPIRQVRWQDVSPVLVVEVVAPDGEDKDLTRNVRLYLQVPSIREYWIVDGREDPDRPTLTVYRRRGDRWQKPIEVAFGETYQTPRLLPGFSLTVDPRPE
jgi:Uma2 family endonuclease